MSKSLIFGLISFFWWAMWAIRSRSLISYEWCERITHIAQRKLAIVSEMLRSLTKNERVSESLIFFANRLFARLFAHFWAKNEWFAQKTDERIPSPGKMFVDSLQVAVGLTSLIIQVANIRQSLPDS